METEFVYNVGSHDNRGARHQTKEEVHQLPEAPVSRADSRHGKRFLLPLSFSTLTSPTSILRPSIQSQLTYVNL